MTSSTSTAADTKDVKDVKTPSTGAAANAQNQPKPASTQGAGTNPSATSTEIKRELQAGDKAPLLSLLSAFQKFPTALSPYLTIEDSKNVLQTSKQLATQFKNIKKGEIEKSIARITELAKESLMAWNDHKGDENKRNQFKKLVEDCCINGHHEMLHLCMKVFFENPGFYKPLILPIDDKRKQHKNDAIIAGIERHLVEITECIETERENREMNLSIKGVRERKLFFTLELAELALPYYAQLAVTHDQPLALLILSFRRQVKLIPDPLSFFIQNDRFCKKDFTYFNEFCLLLKIKDAYMDDDNTKCDIFELFYRCITNNKIEFAAVLKKHFDSWCWLPELPNIKMESNETKETKKSESKDTKRSTTTTESKPLTKREENLHCVEMLVMEIINLVLINSGAEEEIKKTLDENKTTDNQPTSTTTESKKSSEKFEEFIFFISSLKSQLEAAKSCGEDESKYRDRLDCLAKTVNRTHILPIEIQKKLSALLQNRTGHSSVTGYNLQSLSIQYLQELPNKRVRETAIVSFVNEVINFLKTLPQKTRIDLFRYQNTPAGTGVLNLSELVHKYSDNHNNLTVEMHHRYSVGSMETYADKLASDINDISKNVPVLKNFLEKRGLPPFLTRANILTLPYRALAIRAVADRDKRAERRAADKKAAENKTTGSVVEKQQSTTTASSATAVVKPRTLKASI